MTTDRFFSVFSSATVAEGANQFFFSAPSGVRTVTYERPSFRGTARFSLLFTSEIDSTFDDGRESRAGDLCGDYEVSGLVLSAVCGRAGDAGAHRTSVPLTIDGAERRYVQPGESFATDPVSLDTSACDYLAVSMTVRGKKIPCHPENLLPTFEETKNGLLPSKNVYLPAMIGADAPVDLRIGFAGDSITQGIGCPEDSYLHYPAVCARRLTEKSGRALSFWNLGIGFGRGADFASDGSWAAKAKHCDVVTVCFGINDLGHLKGGTDFHLRHFEEILSILKAAGCRVILQAVPPFDLPPDTEALRRAINDRLRADFAPRVDLFFDETPILSSPTDPSVALYGGHPDPAGCRIWGERLADAMLALL